MIGCNVCQQSGFVNLHQIGDAAIADGGIEPILAWIKTETTPHDVAVCHCCGDGDGWYGEPGFHYGAQDPIGQNGPYAYNGGLCECY